MPKQLRADRVHRWAIFAVAIFLLGGTACFCVWLFSSTPPTVTLKEPAAQEAATEEKATLVRKRRPAQHGRLPSVLRDLNRLQAINLRVAESPWRRNSLGWRGERRRALVSNAELPWRRTAESLALAVDEAPDASLNDAVTAELPWMRRQDHLQPVLIAKARVDLDEVYARRPVPLPIALVPQFGIFRSASRPEITYVDAAAPPWRRSRSDEPPALSMAIGWVPWVDPIAGLDSSPADAAAAIAAADAMERREKSEREWQIAQARRLSSARIAARQEQLEPVRQVAAAAAQTPPSLPGFVMAMARAVDGSVWVASEEEGVWCFAADGSRRRFTEADGLPDRTAYALAIDDVGRVWVGHLRNGVSVFDGHRWHNYDVAPGLARRDARQGPLGSRVFDIAIAPSACPSGGDVWIATDCGLTRYHAKRDEWSWYTREEGLPADQVIALTFNQNGDILAATQLDGLAIGEAANDYREWRTSGRAPSGSTESRRSLPAMTLNDVAVADDGTIYVATTNGLAWSCDQGLTWSHWRGADAAKKTERRAAESTLPPSPAVRPLLREDYITSLVLDQAGFLWVGYRTSGFEAVDVKTGARGLGSDVGYVASLLPSGVDEVIAGLYDAPGLSAPRDIAALGGSESPSLGKPERTSSLRLPSSARTLPVELALREGNNEPGIQPRVVFLGDDWVTQGDWVGRYGRDHALLCAMMAPFDHVLGNDPRYQVRGSLGPKAPKGDALRHWIHWPQTDTPRTLYNPIAGVRRQAEWDDHGEVYPMTMSGPDEHAYVTIPDGLHVVSLYFMNKDGHHGNNRYRDYVVEVRLEGQDATTIPLAQARVKDFWGGVYKRFAVQGPGTFDFRVARNHSFNTILSAVFIDRVSRPTDKYAQLPLPWMGGARYERPTPRMSAGGADVELVQMAALWEQMNASQLATPLRMAARRAARIQLYRAAMEYGAPEELLAAWRWDLKLWTAQDRAGFCAAMNLAWERQVHSVRKMLLAGRKPLRPSPMLRENDPSRLEEDTSL
jgi:hypothetical protein